MNSITEKPCSDCGEIKALSEFSKDSRRKYGVSSYCKECQKKRYHRTPEYREKNRIASRIFNFLFPEKRQEATRKFNQKHPERIKEKTKKWETENPDKVKTLKLARRAREKAAEGTFTAQQWESLKEFYDFTCLCCRRREPEIELTHDHVKPLTMGGTHTADNSQPLCRSCNSQKHNKWIDYRHVIFYG